MPALGVCVVIIDQQGRVVLTKRNDLPVWCLPGGRVEAGESFAETAVREVKEETGLDIKLSRLVGVYSRPNWLDGTHDIVFAAQPVGGQLQADQVETVEAGFFDHAALPQPLLPWNAAHIADAFEQEQPVVRSQEIRFPVENVTRRDVAEFLRKQGPIPFTREMIVSLCTPLPPEKNRSEFDD